MLRKKYSYTYDDIENSLQRKSWWAIFFVLPLARRISYFIINYTDIKPNTITLFSFVFAILSAISFFKGTYPFLLMGTLFFEINYLFDCVDGTVARVKSYQSHIGALLDWKLDRLRILMVVIGLGVGQYKINGSIVPLILSMVYLGMNNFIIFTRVFQARILTYLNLNDLTGVNLIRKSSNNTLLEKWLKFTYDRNIMPYYHDIETDAIAFVIGPILNKISICLAIASIMAFVLISILDLLFISKIKKFINRSQ